jgi:hypothetical protein
MPSGWWDDYRERADRITNALRSRLRRGQVQWKWPFEQVGVTPVPCCPRCGALTGKGAPQVRHEQDHGEQDTILDEIGYEGIDHVATARIYHEPPAIEEGESDGTVQ